MRLGLAFLISTSLLAPSLVQGQAAYAQASDVRPWAQGVSEANQKEAFKLFDEGTNLLKDAFFTRAVDRYRQALKYWDHPAIHFNLAKALMNVNEHVDAYRHFNLALKYGGAPLEADQIEQVQSQSKILYDEYLADVIITAQEPGAIIELNGQRLFVAPGRWQGMVKPENATIIASKEGFQTTQVRPNLKTGKKNEVALTLVKLEESVRYERAFSQAIPWTVTGVGVALLGGGVGSMLLAGNQRKEYDRAVVSCNGESGKPILDGNGSATSGSIYACFEDSAVGRKYDLKGKRESAELFEALSVAGYIAGGVTVATGIALFIINREKAISTTESTDLTPTTMVLPYLSPEGAGVSASIRF